MARLIKCPRCQAQIDVTTSQGGATVKCPDCAVQVRVPTGETGKYEKVAAPAETAAAGKSNSAPRNLTPIMRKMAGSKGYSAPGNRMPRGGGPMERGSMSAKQNNTPMIIGGVVAAVALIVVLAVAMGNRKPPEKPVRHQQPIADTQPEDPDPVDPGPTDKPTKPKPALQRVDGKYVAPNAYERGADKFRQGTDPIAVDASIQKQGDDLLRSGNYKEIIAQVHKFFPVVVNNLIAEDETVARKAFECLRDFCDSQKLQTANGANPIRMDLFNSAQFRAGEFSQWVEWWGKNESTLDPTAGTKKRDIDPKMFDWEKFATMLSSGGQGYDDEKRPEGVVMGNLKAIKVRIAVENLAKVMDKSEGGEINLMAARGINSALEHLTGQKMPAINAGSVASVKAKWLEWASKQP